MNTQTPPAILRPPSTLVIGAAGAGKTTANVTLLAEGLYVRMLATEPTAPNRVLEECKKRGIDDSKFDWQFVSPSPPSWDTLIQSGQIVNTMTLKDIADMRGGIAKSDGKQWLAMLISMQQFRSDRTGLILGDVTEWGPDVAYVIDGFTGVSTMSRNLTVGLKPNPAPGEWGVMQSNILNVVQKLTADCKCFLVLIAHVERETNEISGMNNITVSTLGAKLAPKIPPLFTNVVYAQRAMSNFTWSTATIGVDTKNGDLPLADNLPPSFKPIVDAFRSRLKAAQPASVAQPQTVNQGA